MHRRLAYVPGDVNLWPQLTGGEMIDLLAGCAAALTPHVEKSSWRGSSWIREEVALLWKGNRQKVALVAALASVPSC